MFYLIILYIDFPNRRPYSLIFWTLLRGQSQLFWPSSIISKAHRKLYPRVSLIETGWSMYWLMHRAQGPTEFSRHFVSILKWLTLDKICSSYLRPLALRSVWSMSRASGLSCSYERRRLSHWTSILPGACEKSMEMMIALWCLQFPSLKTRVRASNYQSWVAWILADGLTGKKPELFHRGWTVFPLKFRTL